MHYHTINFEVKPPELLYMYYFYVVMHRLHDRKDFFNKEKVTLRIMTPIICDLYHFYQ